MPSSATESMRGVRISGEPVQPRSPYPMSSMKISTMFGRCGDVVVEVMGSSFQAGGLDGFDDLLLEDQEQCQGRDGDRKSTRLNSSHVAISYAVFCLKKENTKGP